MGGCGGATFSSFLDVLMPGSFIDMLPPEAQSLLGGIALLVALVGLIVWAAGVKIARFSVAILLGVAVGAVGSWLLPKFIGVAPITGALVGFALGAVSGAVGFRLLQGLTLALCLGLAVGGMYYRWHILPALATPTITTTAPIGDELIRLDALPPVLPGTASAPATRGTAHRSPLIALVQNIADRWATIPAVHQKRLLIVSIGAASIALLIAFGFARRTTWFTTALLGALLLMAGVNALLHVYGPQYEGQLPTQARYSYLTLGILTLVGMGIQRRFFWPVKITGRAKATTAAENAPAPTSPTP
jgi:hypothetical protein